MNARNIFGGRVFSTLMALFLSHFDLLKWILKGPVGRLSLSGTSIVIPLPGL
jgi:hypothetical protein